MRAQIVPYVVDFRFRCYKFARARTFRNFSREIDMVCSEVTITSQLLFVKFLKMI